MSAVIPPRHRGQITALGLGVEIVIASIVLVWVHILLAFFTGAIRAYRRYRPCDPNDPQSGANARL